MTALAASLTASAELDIVVFWKRFQPSGFTQNVHHTQGIVGG